VVTLSARQTHGFSTLDSEWIVLPLAGSCEVTCGNESFALEGRVSVFDRVSDFAYVPRDATVTIVSDAGGRFALTGAKARKELPARYGAAKDVPVELRGAGSASRQANNFASPEGFETDRLVAVEVLTPGGNWSSYPPHKHDEERPGEVVLEEIYYFEVNGGATEGQPGPGGYQRVYSTEPDRQIDVLAEVNTGDTVLIPYGYHGPTMAAPGYDLYFLNVLAGPGETRSMAFCDDHEHAWIRDSWKGQPVDPRLPMTTHQART
jgi:5-deoxy-glucuronate isomerase